MRRFPAVVLLITACLFKESGGVAAAGAPGPGKCKKMLWWMAAGGPGKQQYGTFIRAAIMSAKHNAPSLIPHIIYDGPATHTPFTRWVESMGGTVHFHTLSFQDRIFGAVKKGLKPPGWENYIGAFFRLDIPLLMANLTIAKEDVETGWVLYTDCDVLILKDINSCSFSQPKIMAAGPQATRGAIESTGVLVINPHALRVLLPALIDHGVKTNWPGAVDQEGTLDFLKGRLDRLDDRFTWKGYWGPGDPSIFHFHGPKPVTGCIECFVYATLTGAPGRPLCGCVELIRDTYLQSPDGGKFFAAVVLRWYMYLSAALADADHDAPLANLVLSQRLPTA